MDNFVLDLRQVGRAQVELVGGKGASLGELSRIEGISVPDGFCVTTEAFHRALAGANCSAEIEIPARVAAEIREALDRHGHETPWAVRSSSTAEDTAEASFAGQYDSFLDLAGPEAVLEGVTRCWVSFFGERAVAYRRENGIGESEAAMALVIQKMVPAEAAGVLFTADPVNSNRRVASIETVPGLAEELVSGQVNPEAWKVRDGEVVESSGGDGEPVLGEEQAVRLAEAGRRIEAHFGCPQDIEWCLADGRFEFVQSRPITTLFPTPEEDEANHVYVSVGHQQMMTDAMKPLGLSFWQMTTPRPMREAGGRLFVDVTGALATPAGREVVIGGLGGSDPLIGGALEELVECGFVPPVPEEEAEPVARPMSGGDSLGPLEADPAVTAELVAASEESLATLKRQLRTRSGSDLLDFIRADIDELKRNLFSPRSQQVIGVTMEATQWLNDQMDAWLGVKNAGDVLTRSAAGNVSAEMGLALLDVADVVRPHPQVVAFLEQLDREDPAADGSFLSELEEIEGGSKSAAAIRSYLERYGMRCTGEIDITRPRWSERPATLLPMVLQNVRNARPGEAGRRFEKGRRAADQMERELLEGLRGLPDGEGKAAETKRRIELVRTFTGYREYPKYGMVSRYFVYKKALLAEAKRLVESGVLGEEDDLFFLRFEELEEVVRSGAADRGLIRRRRREFRSFEPLKPPRVMTSEGESVAGSYLHGELPSGALAGLAVSAGTVEGRARVITELAEADPDPGDILVTAFTDPSWAPVFPAIKGLITEVGGLMTHGAVVAREYGLPAVVGVEGATEKIRDGQRIRLNGSDGYVEILPEPSGRRR